MKKMGFRFSSLTLFIVLLINLALSIPVSADSPGLSITGALIMEDISPGKSQTNTITVSSPNAINVTVEADGMGQALNGSTVPLTAQQDTSPYSARAFITNVDQSSLSLSPGVSQDIHVTISVPAGTAPGERYAVIYIHQTVVQNASIVVAAYIPVIITIPNFTPNPQGSISSLTVPSAYQGKPININTTFNNTR